MSPHKAPIAAAQLAKKLPQSQASTSSSASKPTADPVDQDGKSKSKKRRKAARSLQTDTLALHTIGEGRMTQLPIIFTQDADYFFCVSKTSIRIFSRTTGQVVSTLSTGPGAHFAPITSIMINPANPLQLLTSSLDGHVKVWDFLDGILLRSFDLGLPITAMSTHASLPGLAIVSLKKPRHRDSERAPKSVRQILGALDDGGTFNSIIGSLDLSSTAHGLTSATMPNFAKGASIRPKLLRIGKTREAVALQLSPNGKWLVVIGNDKVQVAQTDNLSSGFTKFISTHPAARRGAQESMTCMAFHPSDSTRFVTGDSVGRIRMWYCLQDKFMAPSNSEAEDGLERHAPSTVMHWHAHAVSSLAFSPNGAHLLSGGEEAVLVIWHLHSSGGAGAQKEFVPRLGAPISSISIANGLDGREQEYAVALADGSVAFISSMSLKVTRSFSRLKIDASRRLPGATPSNYVPLAVHPSTNNVVLLAGHPSSLQFYDPLKDATAMELEIAPSNRVSRADEDQIEPTRVERVAFSPSMSTKSGERGEWMVTFDSRNLSHSSGDIEVLSESSLKFWRWDAMNHRYALNTRIDRPHHGQRLTSITFSPVTYLLVTTAVDGKARSWHLVSRTLKSGRKESYWVCRSVFGYRDQTTTCSAFSADGSILALGQRGIATLWNPDTNIMSAAVSVLGLTDTIDAMSFNGRYLSLASASRVVLWDLISSRQVKTRDLEAGQRCHLLLPLAGVQDGRFCIVASTGSANSSAAKGSAPKPRTVLEVVSGAPSDKAVAQLVERGTCQASIGTIVPLSSHLGVVPEFIALTEDMDLVHLTMADSLAQQTERTPAAESIRGISNVRKTLFDDLFGPSAFQPVDDTDFGLNTSSPAASAAAGFTSLFSTASHLLPPATTLLEAFISRLLPASASRPDAQSRTLAQNHINGVPNKQTDITDADFATASPSEKTIDDILLTDTDDLVTLFRDQILLQPAADAASPLHPLPGSTANEASAKQTPLNGTKQKSAFNPSPASPSKSPRKRKG